MDDHDPLPVEVLLAWGRDWQRYLDAGPGSSGYEIPRPVLQQYIARSNEALALMIERRAKRRGRRGRPAGGGMGAEVAALIQGGVAQPDAMRVIARDHRKPVEAVRAALGRHRRAHRQ